MKTLVGTLLMVVAMLGITACSTLKGAKPVTDASKYTPEYVQRKAYRITRLVTDQVLVKTKDPAAAKDKMIQALADIQALEDKPALSVQDILDIANRVPAVQSSNAALYVNAAALVFEDDLEAMSVNNPVALQYALRGMKQALEEVTSQ